MEKVRLEIGELRVESFKTSDDPSQHRGTINGYENPTDEMDCTAVDTCFATCKCGTADCTAICQSSACVATFIGSGG